MQKSVQNPLLKRQVLREDIKNYLTDLIINGHFKTGERLVETQIAKDLGVSQAPVREAIRDLEQLGLLETIPYRGTFIRSFTLEELKNAYLVRAELESYGIRGAIKRLTDSNLEVLEDLYRKMIASEESGDIRARSLLDNEFHSFIIESSGNTILVKAWKAASVAEWTYFGGRVLKSLSGRELVERHLPILEALRKRNEEEASAVMHAHFTELIEILEI
ncbi:DNA-binding transcriptional regulator, GntR family [Paenibacillus sp. yr247]|uniref:GntR family transcriptional regulator n=1 Tax=Paenibacillus sp. yr247 TaxID=1761880 RepID=UPI0008861283|nr:GntR family transcriptional regulator [Paenibacillus sp. yr247]SDO48643.1 DNA-binding transcriptional regulator, GntR family [Paenibacillus sp. yr247]